MTPEQQSITTAELCRRAPIIPVLVIDDVAHAAPLAKAIVAGGLVALEVTLRTSAALDAIRAMSDVEGGVVGAGTLMTPADVKAAVKAGARFGVSPGASDRVIGACEDEGLPLLPGAVTATEVMGLLERGYTTMKFFPAETSGGAAALKALNGPIPQASFCPTGGINMKNAGDYLALPNVLCAGGSWFAPKDALSDGNWTHITGLARAAADLKV